jgi:hypothetical protein
MASGMASQLPGSYSRRILILLGLIVLIIHCRPWSYVLFEPASEDERDLASCGLEEKNWPMSHTAVPTRHVSEDPR